MTDVLPLLKKTEGYKEIRREKLSATLSHAYLILSRDKDKLGEILKAFAKLIACKNGNPCCACRNCKLIDQGIHPDVITYPTANDGSAKNVIKTEDVTDLIEQSFVKPIENDEKIFLLVGAQDMNVTAQNKLLKTLEEPPANVRIILGSTEEYPLLPTVKSRVKKIVIPPFSDKELFEAMKSDFTDEETLKQAITLGDGTLGTAERLYSDKNLLVAKESLKDVILNMQSSKDVLRYSTKINALKTDTEEILSILSLMFESMLKNSCDERGTMSCAFPDLSGAKGYNRSSIIYALDKITEANRRYKFNANRQALIEWLFFQILEGKYKWQKS